MRARLHIAIVVMLGVVLVAVPIPGTAPATYIDDFPSGLSNYRTGGWQWPYNDGTGAGTVTAGPDNWTVYMDGTYNGLAYAIRQTPEMYDLTVTVDFVIPTRDYTPGDQFFLYLRWKNSTYPDQSACPDCVFPTADSGIIVDFFLGEQTLNVSELGSNHTVTRGFFLTIGRAHEARVELSGGSCRVYLDGMRAIEATNLTSPPGLFGIVAYREDVILDKVRIDVRSVSGPSPPTGPTGPSGPSESSGISIWSPWIVAPVAWLVGVASALAAIMVRRGTRRREHPP